jgi:hypothetical protein
VSYEKEGEGRGGGVGEKEKERINLEKRSACQGYLMPFKQTHY